MALLACKFCGTQPTVHYQNGHIDIFCPAPETKCYPGAWIEGIDNALAVKNWNAIYGEVK